eukprot:m.221025 g.221025  ORF g.221025 m.221025 type:complete len:864 (+) comp33335_c0_seq1:105-2696(+)
MWQLLRLTCIISILTYCSGVHSAKVKYEFARRGSATAVEAMLRRVLAGPNRDTLSEAEHSALDRAVSGFEFTVTKNCTAQPALEHQGRSKLCYSVSGGGGNVVKVIGTSGPDLAAGVAAYLRTHVSYSFAWNRTGGNSVPSSPLDLPNVWPAVREGSFTNYRNSDISYYSNVVTMSYSHVWWSFRDWEDHIDWMALQGVNLALAYTGTEEIERKTLLKFGIDFDTFSHWTNAPAWLAWSRGQSMHGVGSVLNGSVDHSGMTRPMPQQWLTTQWSLQKQILTRLRAIGIVSVLPAFQGNVPPKLASIYPTANISVQGNGRHYAAWLDSVDPLFGKIADEWMKNLIEDFGTDSWYEADGYFTAGRPPWFSTSMSKKSGFMSTSADAKRHVEAAYAGMNRTDPNAIFYYQGWILGGDDEFTEGLVNAVPLGKLVISDMRCEDGAGGCEWTDQNFSFFGAPFIWGVLHNFGGVLGMWGSIPQLNTYPYQAFDAKSNSSIAGVGIFPEGINQNPVYYQFLYDVNWNPTPVSLTSWFKQYAIERYTLDATSTKSIEIASDAWNQLGDSVYGSNQGPKRGNDFCSATDAITSYPLAEEERTAPQLPWYNESTTWGVWQLLIDLADNEAIRANKPTTDTQLSSTLSYDLVNVGRECLAKLSNKMFFQLEEATNRSEVVKLASELMELQDDVDSLLCTDIGFNFGRWILEARAWGEGDADLADYYEWQARAQPTTWLPACPDRPTSNTTKETCGARSDLADYANKQWGGLVSVYYKQRYACYAQNFGASKVNYDMYNKCMDDLAWDFQHDFSRFEHGKLSQPTAQEHQQDMRQEQQPQQQQGEHRSRDKLCWPPASREGIAISKALIKKYRA